MEMYVFTFGFKIIDATSPEKRYIKIKFVEISIIVKIIWSFVAAKHRKAINTDSKD